MKKIDGWDTVEAVRGAFQTLKPGGYVCKVAGVMLTTSKAGQQMLKIAVDIAEGEFAGWFGKMFEGYKKNKADASWPSGAVYYQVCEGASLGRFKGLVMSFEESNPGYKWDWKEAGLMDKKIGAVFGEEEWFGRDNKAHVSVRVKELRPVEGIENVEPPTLKHASNTPKADSMGYGTSLSEDDIPF